MRWMAYIGAGVFAAMVGYVLIGWQIYDFDDPDYEEEEGARIIDEVEIDGNRYWTRVASWRFTGYDTGAITRCFAGNQTAYRIYFRVEPAFRPLAWIVRRCKGHAYRMESQDSQASDPGIVFCSYAHRWKVLEP